MRLPTGQGKCPSTEQPATRVVWHYGAQLAGIQQAPKGKGRRPGAEQLAHGQGNDPPCRTGSQGKRQVPRNTIGHGKRQGPTRRTNSPGTRHGPIHKAAGAIGGMARARAQVGKVVLKRPTPWAQRATTRPLLFTQVSAPTPAKAACSAKTQKFCTLGQHTHFALARRGYRACATR